MPKQHDVPQALRHVVDGQPLRLRVAALLGHVVADVLAGVPDAYRYL